MEFVANEMASILQNVSKNRGNGKITTDDVKHAVAGAYLSVYPGKTMYVTDTNGRRHIYGHAAHGYIYVVKGLSNGKSKKIWNVRFHLTGDETNCTNPTTMRVAIFNESLDEFYLSEILPGSTIKNNELKIIVECFLFYEHTSYYGLSDGGNWGNINEKQAFGFFLITPKQKSLRSYFNKMAIFSPRPGLFDEITQTNYIEP
jgi:hypothetical protein